MQLNFQHAHFLYDPYPIGLAKPVFDDESYAALVDSFPPDDLLPSFGGSGYKKFALNEKMPGYHKFLETQPLWWGVYTSFKQPGFVKFVLAMLQHHGIEVIPSPRWSTRFEFAAMPADGGKIDPHNDIPSKAVTLILSMARPGEWDPAWGGGTDALRPRDPQALVESYKTPLAEFEKVQTFPYEPNQCVIFVRSEQSWHSVGPFTGPPGMMRRTLTVNIERKG